MSFQDRLNATANQNVAPKTAVAQNAVTNHNYTQGRSSVQGSNGVMQGNKGYQAQYNPIGGGYQKQINPIVQYLRRSTGYTTPQITDPLTTNKGFNQALQVIGARNNAKLDMQNRKILQGILGSLISGDSHNRATQSRANIAGMQDATDRRGQDFNAISKSNALSETSRYHDNLNDYYEKQGENGAERNRLMEEKNNMLKQAKSLNPLDEKIKRTKIAESNTGLGGQIGTDVWANLSNAQQEDIKGRYVQTGELPSITQIGGNDNYWDSREYDVSYGNKEQNTNSTQQKAPTPQQHKQEAFNLDTNQTNHLLSTIAKEEGFSLSDLHIKGDSIILPNGKPISIEQAWNMING